jgi:hypothetical protein
MNQFQLIQLYARTLLGQLAGRVSGDERGSATAEQIVMIAAAAVGAAAVGVIIWQKMNDGASNIQTPAP